MLDLGELLLVKTPTEVILRVTIVVKKMMVVMKQDWVLLQQLPINTTTKNVPTIAEKNKTRFAYGNTIIERMKLHKMAVEAIAVIRQFDYENGHPPFEVC
jgi:hypothetical protein